MTVWEWISHGGWLTSPEPTASKRWHPAGGEVGKQAWRERGCWDSACGLLNNHLLALGFFCPPSVPFLISTEVLVTVLLSLVPSSQTNMSERASPVNSKRWRDSGSDSEETCHHRWEGISEPGGRWSPLARRHFTGRWQRWTWWGSSSAGEGNLHIHPPSSPSQAPGLQRPFSPILPVANTFLVLSLR